MIVSYPSAAWRSIIEVESAYYCGFFFYGFTNSCGAGGVTV